ncbi:MAG: aminotransferase class III-fold pyridoxal phosphate-dependent enzyme [Rhizobiales bacterium]|nr:aminotransferase class III-fold pyridoxal phosphate-dependent enzyme [Hyphomicrobiales bacterium]
MAQLSNMAVRDIETVIHPYTNLAKHREIGPVIIEEGKGIYVYDNDGKQYIEGLAGLWCTSLGYGNEELVETAAAQMRRLSYTHIFAHKSNDVAIELAETLKEIVPCEASKVLFCCSGSEANDMQVKLTWYYNNARGKPEKKKIIARQKGYHGVTVASGSLTGLPPVHMDFDLPIQNILHTSCPHYYRMAEAGETEDEFTDRMAKDLDDMIQREGPETVAAFIAEPIMGAGGVLVPPESYFPKINAVLAKYDVRFIADEVICGFGRTGKWFGTETLGMQPTSVSMAKAITSAYFPLGAITIEEDVYQAMLDASRKIGTFGHGYTYTAHPVGAAVALKTIEIYKRDGIVGHASQLGEVFQRRLAALGDHPLVGETRGRGMLGSFEMVADKATKRPFDPKMMVGAKTAAFAQEHGLMVRAMVDAIGICPPLIIQEDELNELFDRIEKALEDTEAWVSKEDLRAA